MGGSTLVRSRAMAKKKKPSTAEARGPDASQGTVGKVAGTVTKAVTTAAKATAKAANEYIAQPVKAALGLAKGPARRPKAPKAKRSRHVRPPKRSPAAKVAQPTRPTTGAGKV